MKIALRQITDGNMRTSDKHQEHIVKFGDILSDTDRKALLRLKAKLEA